MIRLASVTIRLGLGYTQRSDSITSKLCHMHIHIRDGAIHFSNLARNEYMIAEI